jgi:hypothetical protein
MAVKGAILKQQIAEKILEVFPGSFLYNDGKEIRINGIEEGQEIQIKVTLTAAKVAVGGGGTSPLSDTPATAATSISVNEQVPQEPTAEEKERLATLLERLGL